MTREQSDRPCLAFGLSALIVLSLVAITASGFAGVAAANQDADIVVNDDGSGDYETIQDGVDAAEAGETILVEGGTYNEEVVVDEEKNGIELVGADGETPVLDGGNSLETALEIVADDVSIDGLEVRDYESDSWTSPPAIRVDGTSISIRDSAIIQNARGLYILGDDASIENSVISNNDERGVVYHTVDGAELIDNEITDNQEQGVHQSTGFNNDANHVTATDNTITGNGDDGIRLSDGSHAVIERNYLSNNGAGIHVDNNATVVNNVLEENSVSGLRSGGISTGPGSVIKDNEITNARGTGISASDSSHVENNMVHTQGDRLGATTGEASGISIGSHTTVTDNEVSTDGTAAGLTFSITAVNSTVTDNSFENGVYLRSPPEELETNPHAMENNLVNGEPLYYASNENNPDIDDDAAQIILVDVSDAEISGFEFSGVVSEVRVAYSDGVEVTDNEITSATPIASGSDQASFAFWGTTNVAVTGNTLGDDADPLANDRSGILISESDSVTVSDNEIVGEEGDEASPIGAIEDYGIYVYESEAVDIQNNRVYAFTDGIESRDSGDVAVFGNTLEQNYRGIDITTSDPDVDVSVTQNTIAGNEEGLSYSGGAVLDGTDNWWGDETGPSGGAEDPVTGEVADGDGDSIVGADADNVNFDPWSLTEDWEEPESELDIEEFTINNKEAGETFEVDVTVGEHSDVETENLEITLEVEGPDNTIEYDETITPDAIQNDIVTVTFGADESTPEVGPFEADNGYTATATVDADNADSVESQETFDVVVGLGEAIDGCGTITDSGAYELVDEIAESVEEGDACLEIVADDVTLDGNGNTLDGIGGDGTGVSVSGDNVTVENVDVTGWMVGVQYDGTHGGEVRTLVVSENAFGVELVGTDGLSVTQNEIVGNVEKEDVFFESGLVLSSATNNLITDNNISANVGHGINIQSDSDGNTISDNTLSGNSDEGIRVNAADNNVISGNDIHDSGGRGISFAGGSSANNVVESNTISSSGVFGIGLSGVEDNQFVGNTITETEGDGIAMTDHDTAGNEFLENTITDNDGYGINVLFGANENTFADNTLFGNEWDFRTTTSDVTVENMDIGDDTAFEASFEATGIELRSITSALDNEELTSVGWSFEAQPVSEGYSLDITLHYVDDDVSDIDESSLALYRFDEETGEWVELDSTVDTEAQTVSAFITEFSTFGVFGEAVDEDETEDDSEETTTGTSGPDSSDGDDEESTDDDETTVVTDEQTSDDGATVEASVLNANAGEDVPIGIPGPDEDQPFELEGVSVTPAVDGDFDLDIETNANPLATSPDGEFRFEGTEQLGYVSVDSELDNEDIEGVSFTFTVDATELADIDSSPADLSLYRYDEETGEWVEQDTEVLEQDDGEVRFRTTADGFSDWTAAAKTPELDITDTEVDVDVATTDEDVTIQVFVTNTGGADGTYEAQLLANDEIIDREDATVPSNRTVIISFVRSFDEADTYVVQVNDVQVGEITITDGDDVAVETPTPTPTPAEGDDGTDETPAEGETETDESEGSDDSDDGFGPGFGILVALVALLLVSVVARRR